MRPPAYAFALSLAALLTLAGCASGAPLVTSAPATAPIVIDASEREWQGALRPIPGQAGLTMGVRNDGQYLYLAVVATGERLVQQVVRQGLVVWFDPEGGKQKSVGVQFPLGMMGAGRPPGNGPGSGSGGGRRGGPPSEAEMAERFQASLGQLALRRGERDPGERRGVEAVPGLEVAAVLDRGQLVYELRVPLQSEGGFAVGAAPGATVGLGLETPQPARGARERGGPGGERGPGAGGGRPPGGGGMGGGGGMSRPGGGRGGAPASEPFERWVRVVLARP